MAMRTTCGMAILLIAAAGAAAQDPPPPRYDQTLNVRAFPQDSPKEALASAIKAIDTGRVEYLLANLLDPTTTDAKVSDRARTQAAAAENDLRAVRARQKADPLSVTAEQRLPDEPTVFAQRVADEATSRGFRALADDTRGRFAEDPNLVKELRRYFREGELVAQGDTATLSLKAAKGKVMSFRKIDNRWHIDDRTEPMKK